MAGLKQLKVGTEAAAWFQSRFSDEIVNIIHEFNNEFGRLRSEVEAKIEQENFDDPQINKWLEETPESLSHAYEVLAPESAHPNTKVHFVVVVDVAGEYWVLGHYSTLLDSSGSMPGSWQEYVWHPCRQSGIPWPRLYEEGGEEGYLPMPEKTSIDEATNFLDGFIQRVDRLSQKFYGEAYPNMFPEEGARPARQSSMRHRNGQEGQQSGSSGSRGFVSGKSARKKNTKKTLKDAWGSAQSRLGGLNGRSSGGASTGSGGASRRSSGSYTDQQIYHLIDTSMTPYPDWFTDIEVLDNGNYYDDVIEQYGIPVLRSLRNSCPDPDSSLFWRAMEFELVEDGILELDCGYRSGKYSRQMRNAGLDDNGYCTCTSCGINPQYGDDGIGSDLADQGENGECEYQNAQTTDRYERKITRG